MCYIDAIYVYLRARADGAIGRGRPAEHDPKPAVVQPRQKTSAWGERACDRAPAMSEARAACRRIALLALVLACCAARHRRRRRVSARPWNWSIPHVFRVCADPRSMPFSNEAGEGFENKIAELFAAKLGKTVSYTYFPRVTGFVRQHAERVQLRRHHGRCPGRRSGADHQPVLSHLLHAGGAPGHRPRRRRNRLAIRGSRAGISA